MNKKEDREEDSFGPVWLPERSEAIYYVLIIQSSLFDWSGTSLTVSQSN